MFSISFLDEICFMKARILGAGANLFFRSFKVWESFTEKMFASMITIFYWTFFQKFGVGFGRAISDFESRSSNRAWVIPTGLPLWVKSFIRLSSIKL